MRFNKTLLTALAASAAFVSATPAFAQAAGEQSAVRDTSCERACLIQALEEHMHALAARDPEALKLADGGVRFTENNVPLKIGEGLWATVTGVDASGLEAADPVTGNAAWFGSVRENGNPAIYAVRIHVANGKIDEIESVVHRKTALPAPFGDVNQDGPRSRVQRGPSARGAPPARAPAGAGRRLFRHGRIERRAGQHALRAGLRTARERHQHHRAAARPAPAATPRRSPRAARRSSSSGCTRSTSASAGTSRSSTPSAGSRSRAGFFDHANEWDHYKLTDGREMKTALKWPNSISLIEAFRIRNGEIQRIEAVFTYVPYFMHNPFWGPGSTPPKFKHDPEGLRRACLEADARKVAGGMVGNDWQSVPWGECGRLCREQRRHPRRRGDLGHRHRDRSQPLVVADASTGKAVWIGRIEEHGQPSWGHLHRQCRGRPGRRGRGADPAQGIRRSLRGAGHRSGLRRAAQGAADPAQGDDRRGRRVLCGDERA